MTRTIAEGDLNASTEEDMGLFNPIRDELTAIRNGFRKAVNNEVRSRNMKTELITNVSHDLKTPLTAIITYVDLLKKVDIDNPKAAEYIEVLDRKSLRLKKLTEDLVEASKASTGVLSVNREKIGMGQLIDQAMGEWEEKLNDRKLTLADHPARGGDLGVRRRPAPVEGD